MGVANLRKRVGQVFHDPAFLSTSTQETIGAMFSGGTKWVVRIRVPAKARGWWAEQLSSHQGENELLLPRGTQLRLLEVREETPTKHLEAKVRVIFELVMNAP